MLLLAGILLRIFTVIVVSIITTITAAVSAVTITVGIAITIAILLTIAVAIALIRLDTIKNDRHLETTGFHIFDDGAEDILVGDTLTDDEQVHIAMFHQQEGIRDQTNRRRIDNDVVITFAEQFEEFVALLGSNQLSRVGRDRTASDDIETRNCCRRLDNALKRFLVGEE